MGRSRGLLVLYTPLPAPPSEGSRFAPKRGWPPRFAATNEPTGYPRGRRLRLPCRGCFPGRSARIAPGAYVQRTGHSRATSTTHHRAMRGCTRQSTDERRRPEQPCPNPRPHRRAILLAANTAPCAESPPPACRAARTTLNVSKPDRTSLHLVRPEDPRGYCAGAPQGSED